MKVDIDRAKILVSAVNTLILFLVYRVKMSSLLVGQSKKLSPTEVKHFLVNISQTRAIEGFSSLRNDMENIGRVYEEIGIFYSL